MRSAMPFLNRMNRCLAARHATAHPERCLFPAALSHGIGSDSQLPFAIVIVGGLVGALLLSTFLLPTLYVTAGAKDKLPRPSSDFAEGL